MCGCFDRAGLLMASLELGSRSLRLCVRLWVLVYHTSTAVLGIAWECVSREVMCIKAWNQVQHMGTHVLAGVVWLVKRVTAAVCWE